MLRLACLIVAVGNVWAVVSAPVNVPAGHYPPKIMGRDYWTFFTSGKYVNPRVPLDSPQDNPALCELSVFRDAALDCNATSDPPNDGRATFRTVRGNYTDCPGRWDWYEPAPKPGTPCIFRWGAKRRIESLWGRIDLDLDDYRAWRARHPECWGLEAVDEWDNECMTLPRRCARYDRDEKARAALCAKWGTEPPATRRGCLALAKRYYDWQVEKYYGERSEVLALRGTCNIDHLAAAWGAKALWLETTDTTGAGDAEYRWDTSLMFIRGAARQFRLPWCWYVAIFVNGCDTQGNVQNESYTYLPPYPQKPAGFRPWGGVSRSLERRCNYFAYVNGANGVQPEGWEQRFFDRGPKGDKKTELSACALDFAAFHDFTRAHPDRGATYAPVALLTPFSAGYKTYGGEPWGTCPYDLGANMLDGAFYTLVPGAERGRAKHTTGMEFNLHNSKFALMYDVLVPDSPQPAADFAAVLAGYPSAVLLGDYSESDGFEAPLVEYVRGGGTLYLNAMQIGSRFDESFTGVRPGETVPCGKTVRASSGETFAVTDAYELVTLELRGAKALLRDEAGRTVAAANAFGRGRVVVLAPRWMVPKDGASGRAMADTRAGRRAYPFFDWLFTELQRRHFPVTVDGDVAFGLNRTARGHWLWCFNNKGVCKFTDTYAKVDQGYDRVVRIDAARLSRDLDVREVVSGRRVPCADGRFAWPIPAGEFAIFELEERK